MINSETKIRKRIEELLENSGFVLQNFRYDKKAFGNMKIIISSIHKSVEILTDRGEVYVNNNPEFFPLQSPLKINTIEIVVAIIVRDYLMPLKQKVDYKGYSLRD